MAANRRLGQMRSAIRCIGQGPQRTRDAEARTAQEKADAEKREADKRHRTKINRTAVNCLMEGTEMTEELAIAVITLIAKKAVQNVHIAY